MLVLLPILATSHQPSLARLQHGRRESETFGCGPCVPPRICAVSGLLAVFVLLVIGFVPTFFLLLASPDPCDTALGACGSISCVCGNFLQQGYVWMFVTLFVASMLLMKEFVSLPGRVNRRVRALKTTLAAASLLLCLTAIFPEHFSMDASDPELFFFAAGYALHGFGLGIASLLLVFLPFGCIALASRDDAGHRYTTLDAKAHADCQPPPPPQPPPLNPHPPATSHNARLQPSPPTLSRYTRYALLTRSAHVGLAVAYAGAFAALKGTAARPECPGSRLPAALSGPHEHECGHAPLPKPACLLGAALLA